jgi:hypothetical protein
LRQLLPELREALREPGRGAYLMLSNRHLLLIAIRN